MSLCISSSSQHLFRQKHKPLLYSHTLLESKRLARFYDISLLDFSINHNRLSTTTNFPIFVMSTKCFDRCRVNKIFCKNCETFFAAQTKNVVFASSGKCISEFQITFLNKKRYYLGPN